MEFLNHSNDGHPYLISNEIKCSGFANSEVFARYHHMIDGFDFFQIYNFANEAKLALSCNTSINIPEIGKISIIRTTIKKPKFKSLFKGQITKRKEINFYDVELANTLEPHKPLVKFNKLCGKYNINKKMSQTIFKGLLKHNIIALNKCLQMTIGKDTRLLNEIENVSRNQLKILQDQCKFHNYCF